MNPEIKKFWEKQGRIARMGDRSPEYYTWYLSVERDPFAEIFAHEWKDGSKTIYFWLDHELSEREMLSIVNLKAFL